MSSSLQSSAYVGLWAFLVCLFFLFIWLPRTSLCPLHQSQEWSRSPGLPDRHLLRVLSQAGDLAIVEHDALCLLDWA